MLLWYILSISDGHAFQIFVSLMALGFTVMALKRKGYLNMRYFALIGYGFGKINHRLVCP